MPRDVRVEQMHEFLKAVSANDLKQALHDAPLGEAMKRVEPMVEDAIERIARHALPYFMGVADCTPSLLRGFARGIQTDLGREDDPNRF